MSKVFGVKRNRVSFEYEFLDGSKEEFTYLEPNSKMIDETLKNVDDPEKSMEIAKKQLKECLVHEDKKMIDKLYKEQYKDGNIYEFIGELNELVSTEKGKKIKN